MNIRYVRTRYMLLISSLIFAGIVWFLEFRADGSLREDNQVFAKFLRVHLWNIDTTSARDYMQVIVRSGDFEKITINHSNGDLFAEVANTDKPGLLEKAFRAIGLIRIHTIKSPIVFEKKKIGTITTRWINKQIYTYAYVLFSLLLIVTVLRFYFNLSDKQKEIQDKNEKLREEIAERKKALEKIQTLKFQQDGDYFLTSLVLSPLSSVDIESSTVRITQLVKQKKQFSFKKWDREIGGDINIADTIRLKDKSYVVFVNGDAMGKSLQGAVGALVYGAVFRAIISRTKIVAGSQSVYPERWLKNAFIELHKVFESFDGTMMLSVVIGLIEEDTGMLYFVNAEHPFSVLYRDGVAEFINTQAQLTKLGSPIVDGEIQVETVQLEAGDIIISGSDGRDDIILGEDDQGYEIINEDHEAFLHSVAASKGDLELVYKEITGRGRLKDDLSLVRIEYTGPTASEMSATEPQKIRNIIAHARKLEAEAALTEAIDNLQVAQQQGDNHPRIEREIVRLQFKSKNYRIAAKLASEYITEHPGDLEIMYLASYTLKHLREFEAAADIGERIKLRDPAMVRNLLNLAEVHYHLKNYGRAAELVTKAEKLNPDSKGLVLLQQKINARRSLSSDLALAPN